MEKKQGRGRIAEMTKWQKWQNDEWQIGRIAEMAKWQKQQNDKWENSRMTEIANGRIAEKKWQSGKWQE